MALTPQEALKKMSSSKSPNPFLNQSAETGGQPKLIPSPGKSVTTDGTKLDNSQMQTHSAPGNGSQSNPAVPTNKPSTPGQPVVDTAPTTGARHTAPDGHSDTTKKAFNSAGFAHGLAKAAAAAEEENALEAFAEELDAAGISPEVFDALDTLEAHGIKVVIEDAGVSEKVASAKSKLMAMFGKGDKDDKDDSKKKPGAKKDDKKSAEMKDC